MKPSPSPPLVIRFGAMGDMVLLTVLLRILHERYGQPCELITSGGWSRPLLADHPDVAGVTLIGSRSRPYWIDRQQLALVGALRVYPPGPVYVCDYRKQDKLRGWLQRARVAESQCLFHDRPADEARMPWVERWQRFGQRSPSAYADVPLAAHPPTHPQLHVTAAAREELNRWRRERRLDGRLWLLQPGSKRTLKRGRLAALGDDKWWPVDRWVALTKTLLAEERADHVLLCGAPNEQALLQEIATKAGSPRVHALGNELPVPRLLALSEVATGMVSVDTGPAHAAVALGCPAVVLYGASPPEIWLPRGPAGTDVRALGGDRADRLHVEQIALDEVVEACRELHIR